MFFDLNIPVPPPATLKHLSQPPKKKGKTKPGIPEPPGTTQAPAIELFSQAQVDIFERKIDVLSHLGYTVFALNQTIQTCFSPNGHVNYLEELSKRLKVRDGIVILKRLTILLDDASEKGIGLTKNHQAALMAYDILSLQPTSQATFSLACLKHSAASPLTAHIITLPLTGPRLPFFFKHTLIRTAIKNGAAFEVTYSPAVGGAGDVERRNWWAACRELTRVTKGKGVIFSSGTTTTPMTDVRAPQDIINIATMLGFAADEAKKALSNSVQSLVIRAYTRKTHQSVLSEPTIVYPDEPDNGHTPLKRPREAKTDEEEGRPTKRPKP